VSGTLRVVVGASGSPGSLRALRYARDLACACDAPLIPVLAWVPPGGDLADRRAPCGYLRRIWAEDAEQRLREALTEAWGGIPTEPPVQPLAERGQAGWILVTIAGPGDLLVVGAGHRGALAPVLHGRVSRYCLAHARCPVLAVPPPALAQETSYGLLGWTFWHRPLTLPGSSRTRTRPRRNR
jgi:nucleotide-binding universal stress UspA family protein